MNHTTNVVAEIVNRLELWFEQQGGNVTDYIDVGFIFDATSGLWGCASSSLQISQALQKVGSPKLHTNDDGSMIRCGTVEQVLKYQIEYYFGDKNYYKDSFLQAFKTDGNPEGFVPIMELLRFTKMKRISPSLPPAELVQLISNVLSESDVVAVHADRIHLRKLSVEEGIVKKVEYFFLNTHLPYDSYIPISTLATLPKLQRYEYDFIERTLQKVTSTVFELSNDKSALRKKTSYKGALMVYHTNPTHTTPLNRDYVVEPLRLQVTKYIEYLFGDVNFPKDNFMQRLSKQNKEGFIPLHEIMSFPRMRKLCTDRARIVEWLAHSDVVAWSEDMNFLRRKKPLPELRKIIYSQLIQDADVVDDSPQTFTVMTYNILADFLTTKFQFPYTTPETRNWEIRKTEILKEILFYQPDVVCLQEVQTSLNLPINGKEGGGEGEADEKGENDHLAFFVANLAGYDYIYKRKTRYKAPQNIGPDIGNALFFNTSKFSLVSKNEIEYERVLWAECKKDAATRAMVAQGHPQVAIFVTLRHIPSGNNIFVATTHICSDYQTPYIQMRQVRACLSELQRCNKLKAPIVLAGDFNTQPESPIYYYLAHGHVPKPLHRELQNSMRSPRHVDYHHELGLSSAYAKVLGREPRCTNATHEFEGTLDYLWYSKKSLRPTAVLDIPSLAYIKEEVGLPSKKFPSDHLPLFCKFKFASA